MLPPEATSHVPPPPLPPAPPPLPPAPPEPPVGAPDWHPTQTLNCWPLVTGRSKVSESPLPPPAPPPPPPPAPPPAPPFSVTVAETAPAGAVSACAALPEQANSWVTL